MTEQIEVRKQVSDAVTAVQRQELPVPTEQLKREIVARTVAIDQADQLRQDCEAVSPDLPFALVTASITEHLVCATTLACL
jgi:hypothetical protein